MHIPSKFKEVNLDRLHEFIQEYPLGTLIVSAENTLDADHIPFYLQKQENEQVILQSHIAKANPLWKKVADGQDVLLIFHGPNAYISPNFYPSKKETGKVVPHGIILSYTLKVEYFSNMKVTGFCSFSTISLTFMS